jgi:hypothetical protein
MRYKLGVIVFLFRQTQLNAKQICLLVNDSTYCGLSSVSSYQLNVD